MKKETITKTYTINGMTCAGCEAKTERILGRLKGVRSARASFSKGTVTVAHDAGVAGVRAMADALGKAGYTLQAESLPAGTGGGEKVREKKPLRIERLLGIGILLFAAYFIIDKTIGFNFIPEIGASMGYGMLFVVGLLTSIHCVAMCGGINMSQCVTREEHNGNAVPNMKPSLMYNAGRVVSYTVIGGIVGAIGSVIGFSGWARGIVAVLAGLFMVLMGLGMLGIFPWLNRLMPRMPRFMRETAGEAGRGKGPFAVGLLNGLMPCGPLQAMQIYALGTGSFLAGALSMLLFSLGTVPLMFGLGALSSLLSARFTARMMKVSAALVLLLGVVMFNRGLALSGVSLTPPVQTRPAATASATAAATGAPRSDGVQHITSKLGARGYPEITVQKGVPVRWNMQAGANDLNGCNRALIIPEFNMQVALKAGDNIIEFVPEKSGTIPYSCWMGMITGSINVVDNGG